MVKNVAFLHNNCKSFRHPVFSNLEKNNNLNVDFIFLEKPSSELNSYQVIRSLRIPGLQDFSIPIGLYRILKSKNYDYVISTDLGYVMTYVAYFYCHANNKKFVLWNEQWKHIKHPRRIFTRIIEKLICKNSYKILAFGKKHSDFVRMMGAKQEQIIIAPNIVPDIEKIVVDENADYISYDKGCKYILCLARLIKIKGHESLIKAFARISNKWPNYRLILAGEGPEFNKLSQLIRQLGLDDKVYMPNRFVNENHKAKLFELSDIFILPSIELRAVEAWGLVVNEAAKRRKKIIVSSATGVADELIVHGVSGLIYEQNNYVELAERIEQCLESSEVSESLAQNAFDRVTMYYNIDVLSRKLEICFDE